MSEGSGVTAAKNPPGPLFWIGLVLRVTVGMALLAAVLFLVSGRWDWTMAWVYVGVMTAGGIANAVLTLRRHPDLFQERIHPPADAKRWDRWLVRGGAMYGPLATYITVALNQRFGWSAPLPVVVPWAGLIVFAAAYVFGSWALAVNPFFSAIVRIQRDRGHRVIDTGPYRLVRHPGYLTAVLTHLLLPVIFESAWAWIPAALTVALIVARTALEDRTLQAELEGYAAYAERVRRRLLPGIW